MHSICQQIWKILKWPQDFEKVSFHSNPQKSYTKECSNYCTIALISCASKVVLKILQTRLQQYVNQERSDVQAGFRKGRGTRDQFANICWIIEKAREFQKNIYFCFIDYSKAFGCVDSKIWKSIKDIVNSFVNLFTTKPRSVQFFFWRAMLWFMANAQNSPSQGSTVLEPRNSRCSGWFQKRQRNQRSNC